MPVRRARRGRRLPLATVSVAALVALATAALLASFVGGHGTTEPAAAPAPSAKPAVATPKAKPALVAVRARPRARHRARAPLTLAAVRGTCWLSVRVGSAEGRVLFQRFLRPGRTIRFGLKHPLWIRLGAPWNVDARIGGRRLALPGRTGNVLVRAPA